MNKLRPVDCGDCTLCCQLETVHLTRKEDGKFQTEEYLDKDTGQTRRRLAHDSRGNCVYLGAKGCSIWHVKPEACNAYDCLLWVKHFGEEKCRQRMHDRLFAKAMKRLRNEREVTRVQALKPKMWRKGRAKKVKR